jgi:hypothetical protein
METTKRKTESQTKENWMMAKRQAEQMGIVLTRNQFVQNPIGRLVHCELRKRFRALSLFIL